MIIWQDIALAVASTAFAYSLIPQIIQSNKTKIVGLNWQTVIITIIGMITTSICAYSLQLYFTSIMNFIVTTCWIILGVMKYYYNGRHNVKI